MGATNQMLTLLCFSGFHVVLLLFCCCCFFVFFVVCLFICFYYFTFFSLCPFGLYPARSFPLHSSPAKSQMSRHASCRCCQQRKVNLAPRTRHDRYHVGCGA